MQSLLQEMYLAANKRHYMASVDLEKMFDRVPRKIIWWALWKLGVEKWIVQLVQGGMPMRGAVSVLVSGYCEEYEVKDVVHQGLVLSHPPPPPRLYQCA